MWCGADWDFVIMKDEFQLFFPDGDYDIYTLAAWYKTIPTKPEKIAFYGDNENLLKRHFEEFREYSNIKSKITNDLHSNKILNVWCLAIYNSESELVGFAAQEYINGFAADKKILYFGELRE